MQRLIRLILIFAIAYAVLIISPAFLGRQFPPYPFIKWGDVTDIFTPLVLIPLYWLLFRLDRSELPSRREVIAFLVFAALWVEGQGMHLGANSIGHLMKTLKTTDAYALTEFYDEVLGHYLWHGGAIALSGLLMWRQWQNPLVEKSSVRSIALAAFIYGFTYFVATVEAGTVPIGVPFALVITFLGLWKRSELSQRSVTQFFVAAHLIAVILFAVWAIMHGGSLPQFSEVGIIE